MAAALLVDVPGLGHSDYVNFPGRSHHSPTLQADLSGSSLRHTTNSDYTLWLDITGMAGQDTAPTESYGNFGLSRRGFHCAFPLAYQFLQRVRCRLRPVSNEAVPVVVARGAETHPTSAARTPGRTRHGGHILVSYT